MELASNRVWSWSGGVGDSLNRGVGDILNRGVGESLRSRDLFVRLNGSRDVSVGVSWVGGGEVGVVVVSMVRVVVAVLRVA